MTLQRSALLRTPPECLAEGGAKSGLCGCRGGGEAREATVAPSPLLRFSSVRRLFLSLGWQDLKVYCGPRGNTQTMWYEISSNKCGFKPHMLRKLTTSDSLRITKYSSTLFLFLTLIRFNQLFCTLGSLIFQWILSSMVYS